MTVEIGDAGQFALVVDTGSSDLLLPRNSSRLSHSYNSSTWRPVQCPNSWFNQSNNGPVQCIESLCKSTHQCRFSVSNSFASGLIGSDSLELASLAVASVWVGAELQVSAEASLLEQDEIAGTLGFAFSDAS